MKRKLTIPPASQIDENSKEKQNEANTMYENTLERDMSHSLRRRRCVWKHLKNLSSLVVRLCGAFKVYQILKEAVQLKF